MAAILVIEDEEDIRFNISELLALTKHYVFTASNGKEGIELAQRLLPDLIICDIIMPFMDGFGVLQVLKSEPPTRVIPFIFLTSKSESSNCQLAMNLGANDYIVKPFEWAELLTAVNLRLRKAAKEKELQYVDKPMLDKSLHNVKKAKGPLKSLAIFDLYTYLVSLGMKSLLT